MFSVKVPVASWSWVSAAFGVALVGLTLSWNAHATSDTDRPEQHDLARMAIAHPAAVASVNEGEKLASAGKTEEALVAFQKAAAEVPESPLAARRECEMLTALGRRAEAIQACLRALRNDGAGLAMRAMVGAYMSGQERPTTSEFAQAMRLARRARDSMPSQPWGHAAECDVAERLGDAQMAERCLRELVRVAPDHAETARALRAAAPWLPGWRVWISWPIILLVVLGTVLHALWHAVRSPRRSVPVPHGTAVVLAVVLGLSVSTDLRAQSAEPEAPAERPSSSARMLSDWPVDDKDPESSVPPEQKKQRNPLQFGYWLMDLSYKATAATKAGDHQAAIRFYKALAKAVPDRSVSYTRLCESYEAAGEWKNAVEACATALTRDGVTAGDYSHYFAVALAKKGPLSKPDIEVLTNVLDHLRGDPVGREMVDDLECQLALRLEDVNRLQKCTNALVSKSPDNPRTISYQWALALKRGNFDEATSLIERARATDMKPEGIDQMVRGLEAVHAVRRRKIYAWGFGALAVVIAAAGVVVLVSRRRRSLGAAAT
jgi:tetratricopeptide (TPR) repeat protein